MGKRCMTETDKYHGTRVAHLDPQYLQSNNSKPVHT